LAGDTASLTGLTTDRFMSTDPIIQAPSNLQSHNRCADVVNNPLNLTDPSGFSAWTRFRDKILKPVVFAYIGYLTGGLISNALISGASTGFAVGANGLSTAFVTLGGSAGSLTTLGGVLAGAGGGFVAGALSSGTLDGGLRGALTGGVFGGIGATGAANGWGAGQYVAAHAAGGCITSVAGGGACGSGAASAAFGKFTTIAIGDVQGDFAKGVASTVAGGVGSVIAGGKFENGATTAAFGYLFNEMLSTRDGRRFKSSGRLYHGDRSLSDSMAFSPAMAEQAYEFVNNVADGCGVAYGPCRAVASVMGYADGAVKLASTGDGAKLGGALTGDRAGDILSASMNTAQTLPGARKLPGKMFDALVHSGSWAIGKAAEEGMKK
jgi:hypothetical protein